LENADAREYGQTISGISKAFGGERNLPYGGIGTVMYKT